MTMIWAVADVIPAIAAAVVATATMPVMIWSRNIASRSSLPMMTAKEEDLQDRCRY
ncbi:MAG: hypothetical protein R2849_04125 [Thermomicrobiales bacterium]